jgi:hypothetical protein
MEVIRFTQLQVISYTQLLLFQTTGDKATKTQNGETRPVICGRAAKDGNFSCLTVVRGHEMRRRKTHYYWTQT